MNNSFIRKQPNCEFILRRCHGWSGAKVQKKRSLDWPLVLKDHLLNNFPTDFPLANLVPFLIFPLKPPFFPWRFLSQLGFSHRMLVSAGATTHAAAHAWCAHGWKAGRDGPRCQRWRFPK